MLQFNNYLRLLLLCICISNATISSAQSPGSISGNLGLWLDANALTPGGSKTDPWGRAAYGPSSVNYQVIQNINSNQSILLDDDWFTDTININVPHINIFTVYKLSKPPHASSNAGLWGNGGTGANRGKQATTGEIITGANTHTYSPNGNTLNKTYIHHVNINTNNGSHSLLWLNGVQGNPTYTAGNINTTGLHNGLFIGKSNSTNALTYPGDSLHLAEFIVYKGGLTTAEREQVNAYLAIKYGITLPHDYTINNGATPVWTQSNNAGYTTNITAIAKDNVSQLDQTTSKSENAGSILSITAVGNITNNEGLAVGTNGSSATSATAYRGANNFFAAGQRLDRVWKCQKTASFNNTVNIAINTALPSGFAGRSLILLTSSDPNFTTDLEAYPISSSGTNRTASSVALENGDYFTIAYSNGDMWVKADGSGNTISGTAVHQLGDHIFGRNNMSGVNISGGRPVHTIGSHSSAINFNPYITFNRNNTHNYVEKSNFIGLDQSGTSSFLVLRRETGSSPGGEALMSYATSGHSNEWLLADPTDIGVYVEANFSNHNNGFDIVTTPRRPHIVSNIRGNSLDDRLGVNGSNHDANYENTTVINSGGTLIFGQEQDAVGGSFANNQEYNGDFAEAIILSKRASNSEQNAIESYLAVKYGITLTSDYALSDNTVTWNNGSNTNYNTNIAGIGRDDAFQLDQKKSMSQNGTNVDIVVEHPGTLNNLSHLIWGCDDCGNYSTVSSANAPSAYKIPNKHWKAQNTNVGLVNITLNIPSGLASLNAGSLRLLISSSPNFSAGFVRDYTGSVNANNTITFTGVDLLNNHYFTIGGIDDIGYVNLDPGAPNAFEACPGSEVEFQYTNLSSHPNQVQLMDTMGNPIIVTGTPNQTSNSPPTGSLKITIPGDAGTGNVILLDNSTIVYDFDANLIIHNPQLEFYPQANPVCATDIVPLIGFPAGGIFSSPLMGFVLPTNQAGNQVIIGEQGDWSNVNENARNFPITYTYTPKYLNGASCAQSLSKADSIEIRDNRIDELTFNYIIQDDASGNPTLGLDAVTIQSISPDLLDPSFPFDTTVSFSGTYVDSSGGVYQFLADQTIGQNPVTLRYKNKGCIGEFTANIDVFPPLRIIGLLDTMCTEADSIHFGRDTLPDYAYSLEPINQNYTNYTVTGSIERNKITKVITQNPAYQSAIDTISTTNNAENYSFTPSNLPSGVTTVIVEMHYTTTSTRTISITNPASTIGPTTRVSNVIAFDTIHMIPRPVPDISGLDSIYCENTITDTLLPSPFFESSERTYFKFIGNDGLAYTIMDTLLNDTLFAPSYHYNKHVINRDRHLEVQLVYVVDRHGCFDTDTAYTTIIAPTQPIFFPQIAYCVSDFPTPLTPSFVAGSFPPAGGSGVFFSIPGLDTTTNLFDPNIATPGYHEATYRFTDNFGCANSYTDTLYVREPPQIKLEAGGASNNGFCSNETNVQLQTILLPGTGTLDSVRYFGAGVTNNTLDPSAIFPNPTGGPSAGGNSQIWNLYVDSFGCAGRDTLDIVIREIPKLRIDSLFNNTQRYCGNDPAFLISGFVLNSSGQFVEGSGTITGNGVTIIDTTYYYDPSAISVDSIFNDTVSYRHTDLFGCSNVVDIEITIDSVPELTLSGLDTSYCINYPSDQLIGMPDSNSLNNQIVFGGPGVNPNTGIFNPANAGTGQKIISYTFENSKSCANTIYDTIVVYGLPTPLFGGYENQYCSADPNDTLTSLNDITLGSSFRFWGEIIINTTSILDPDNNDSVGVIAVYYTYTDSLGCSNTDSTNIFIHPSPEISINNLDSAYCFGDPEDNIAVSPSGGRLENEDPGFQIGGNNIIFDPDQDTAGIKTFTYIYTDPFTTCADTALGSTFVRLPPTPSFTGLDTFYCENKDTFPITGIPSTGVFTGSGIVDTFSFNPAKAGSGTHSITYTVNDTFPAFNLVCVVDTTTEVRVRPLPVPKIQSPGNNHRFCDTDSDTLLTGISPIAWQIFTSPTGGITYTIDTTYILFNPPQYLAVFDTSYYFSPSSVSEGTHFVTYIAMNAHGCKDSIKHTYIVDEYNQPRFALDSVFCESEDSTILFGVPGGGTFTRDNNPLSGSPPYFIPNPNYGTTNLIASILDTIIYTVQDGACYGTDTQIVLINPVPVLDFTGTVSHNTYCLSSDTIPLTPNITGGRFDGNGVLFGRTDFIPNIAGAGHHPIFYNYTDPMTNCSSEIVDTFSVFGTPNVGFQVVGGCELDSVLFLPDNAILGINNIFNNQVIDSITKIRWEFTPNDTLVGTSHNNQIDSVYHVFSGPGVYDTKLYVANREYCIDTHNVRLVISPKINSFPYDETFENSHGNWYAESRSSSHPLLWEWGIDSTANGIPSNKNNHFWATQSNSSYTKNEDAWVYSPCFDISNLDRPMIKLDYWSDTRSSVDGTVLEYQKVDGTWAPLGQLNRGIEWFNTHIITGQPGDQNLAPIGWSGQSSDWTDARYMLDEFNENSVLRLRFAFGSPSIDLNNNFYDGFGFDNVWIGSRTRNVLLETTSNINEPNMAMINNHVYQLAFHTTINKDLILLQYNCKPPIIGDIFHSHNPSAANSRVLYYSGQSGAAGKSFIDGRVDGIPWSRNLQIIDFEKDMLESPKFSIKIKPFTKTSNSSSIRAVVTALVDIPDEDTYTINMAITEDSLVYPNSNNDMVHAVVRENNVDMVDYEFANKTWSKGDSIEVFFDWNHGASAVNYNHENFQAVVFIQASTKEVFQAATSRDVSDYWIGVDRVKAEPELKEIMSMNLYPNPAGDYFKVDFDKELMHDYNWKLIDIRGVEVRSGIVPVGSKTLEVNNYDLPTGVYIFVVSNENVFSQRKVIIRQH